MSGTHFSKFDMAQLQAHEESENQIELRVVLMNISDVESKFECDDR
jgi:hypothetical protein